MFLERINAENLRILSKIDELYMQKDELISKHFMEIQEEKSKYVDLNKLYHDLIEAKNKTQIAFEEKITNLTQVLADKENVLKYKYETEKKLAISHVQQEKVELEVAFNKKVNDMGKKYEEILGKYNRAKQQKSVVRFSDNNSQRYAQELSEKDRVIDGLRRERNILQTSLDYLNSTVRIFSSQEKAVHTKNNSYDPKIGRNPRTPKFSTNIKF